MSTTKDLFDHTPAQGSLFGDSEDRLPEAQVNTRPDPEKIRMRLDALLEKVRSSDTMPWSERDRRMWQTVFPQMTNWLPEEEAAQYRFAFAEEMRRFEEAA